jgi:two-component system sensor histidine kinase VicK
MESETAEAAGLRLNHRPVELAATLRQLLADWQARDEAAGHRFELHCTSEEVHAELDPVKLRQVLDQLLSNAVKFTPQGGRVAVALAQQPGHVLLSVADEGVGIPERLHPVLFDRFTKARRPGLRGEKSTGLGMFITRALVERHGGRIWFESREGAGTTFYVQLPAHGPV